ncbi:MAG TPA: glycosyltransferase family 2 protein [Desulfobacteraceae bacterium]|nr:glycosyltransferase family 2 protein [Desulfobacteraceae bacterium]
MTVQTPTDRKQQPLVAIIILTCNQKEVTLRCLESFARCTYGGKKIALVDNGSSDNVLDEVAARFPEVECLRNEHNLGAAAGRNTGIDFARLHWDFEYILFIDNDTTVTPPFLDELVSALQGYREQGVEIASPKVYVMGGDRVIDSAGGAMINYLTASTQSRGAGEIDQGQYDRDLFSGSVPTTVCVILHRKALDRADRFDVSFDPYGYEDLDMILRARGENGRFLFVPRSIIYHKGSRTGFGGYTGDYTSVKAKNMKRFFKRHSAPWQWVCFNMLLPFLGLRTLARELKKGNIGAVKGLIKGYLGKK